MPEVTQMIEVVTAAGSLPKHWCVSTGSGGVQIPANAAEPPLVDIVLISVYMCTIASC